MPKSLAFLVSEAFPLKDLIMKDEENSPETEKPKVAISNALALIAGSELVKA
jgi:hypothetical protein